MPVFLSEVFRGIFKSLGFKIMAAKLAGYAAERDDRLTAYSPLGRGWRPRGVFNIWLYRLVRMSLAIVFLASGILKLSNPASFAVIIDSYGFTPESLNLPVAVFLAALEALAGLALFFDVRASLSIVTGLLALFVVILGYGIGMGLDIDCGCFGPEDAEAEAYHGLRPALYRDLAMLFGAAYLYGWRYVARSAEPVSLLPWVNKTIRRRGNK